ncbi:hypothetical protein Tco_0394128 [Tanacetum coccineum]
MQIKGILRYGGTLTTLNIPQVSITTCLNPFQKARDLQQPLNTEKTIPPNDFPEPENNWANTYATTYKVPEENQLQRKTGHQIQRNVYEPLPLGGPPGQLKAARYLRLCLEELVHLCGFESEAANYCGEWGCDIRHGRLNVDRDDIKRKAKTSCTAIEKRLTDQVRIFRISESFVLREE